MSIENRQKVTHFRILGKAITLCIFEGISLAIDLNKSAFQRFVSYFYSTLLILL